MKTPESIDYSAKKGRGNGVDLSNRLSNGILASSLPIPTMSPTRDRSIGKSLYYTSARSLASSHTPTPGSYLVASSRRSGRSGPSFILNQSSVDDEGLLANIESTSPTESKTMLRSVAAIAFFVVWLNYFHLQGIPTFHSTQIDTRAAVVLTGRKLLQEASIIAFRDSAIGEWSSSRIGTWLGWIPIQSDSTWQLING